MEGRKSRPSSRAGTPGSPPTARDAASRVSTVETMLQLPRLYAILDAACFPDAAGIFAAAEEIAAAGVTLLQYRNKGGNARRMLDEARDLRAQLGANVRLIMNDRADLCLAAQYDGLHLGQDDLSAESARHIIGPTRWLGVSTHNPEQLAEADKTSADYL